MALEAPGTTLVQYIREAEKLYPEATGEFSLLLNELGVATKIISREVNRAGLLKEILGRAGQTNVQGEEQQKLDVYADEVLVRLLGRSGCVGALASEENDDPIPLPQGVVAGRYAVLFDPLDGSSNIDVNAPIGTIFSIRRMRDGEPPEASLIGPGSEQVAAGYVVYGSSTMLVYTTGEAVNGFTLDPTVGEYLLSHPGIRIPSQGAIYSVNEGNRGRWDERLCGYIDALKEPDAAGGKPYSARYIGSFVADFHRTLLRGGIFLYPADAKSPRGKLRYLYEAAPMALLAVAAGGAASDGSRPILDHAPKELHERVPLFIGSAEEVAKAERYLASGA